MLGLEEEKVISLRGYYLARGKCYTPPTGVCAGARGGGGRVRVRGAQLPALRLIAAFHCFELCLDVRGTVEYGTCRARSGAER